MNRDPINIFPEIFEKYDHLRKIIIKKIIFK
jgi:hypothetical protein